MRIETRSLDTLDALTKHDRDHQPPVTELAGKLENPTPHHHKDPHNSTTSPLLTPDHPPTSTHTQLPRTPKPNPKPLASRTIITPHPQSQTTQKHPHETPPETT